MSPSCKNVSYINIFGVEKANIQNELMIPRQVKEIVVVFIVVFLVVLYFFVIVKVILEKRAKQIGAKIISWDR